jgi:magnesium transporter
MASHLVDSQGTVEPNIDPEGVARRIDDGVFFWLDLESPADEELELLHRELGIHPLALEDARKFGQRPKIDDYDEFTALVVFGA